METLFKHYFWVIQLVVSVAAALLIGAGISRVVVAKLAPYEVAVPAKGQAIRRHTKPKAPPRTPSISEVGFPHPEAPTGDEACADVECDEGESCNPDTGTCEPNDQDETPDEGLAEEGGPCYDTELKVDLAGTMVSADPRWSIAVLHDPGADQTLFAAVGDTVLSQARVTSISRNRVMIVRDGYIECLRPKSVREAAKESQKDLKRRRVKGAAKKDKKGSGGGQDLDNMADSAVQKTGRNQYEIDQDALQKVLHNPQKLREEAPTVAPYYRDGDAAGFRLSGVKSDSIFSQLGIRNGDVIHSVNGQVIDSPQRAMSLYKKLGERGTIKMEVLRGGRPTTLTYKIQ